jgi:hypothetical protein
MKRSLVDILRGAHLPYIAFNPAFARATESVSAGVLLAQILNLDSMHGAGFYRTAEQLRADTGMKEREYKNAKAALIEGGFVTTELKGIPAKLCWSVVWDKIAMVLGEAGAEPETVQATLDTVVQTGLDTEVQDSLDTVVQTNKKNKEKNKEKGSRFAPPTVAQVREYAESHGYKGFDADRFVNYYAAIGWVVGKSRIPMKDWKPAVVGWHFRDRKLNHKAEDRSIREVIL